MTATQHTVSLALRLRPDGRRLHRLTCILAGGLALTGGTLAVAVQPGFAGLAAVAGLWLLLVPDAKGA